MAGGHGGGQARLSLMSSWQPLLWLGFPGGWGEGERAQWTSVLEPLEDALYRSGWQSQEKHAPGPAPGRSLQLWTGTCFLCSWDFLGSPLDGQYLQRGAAARSGPNTRSTGKCRPVGPWPPQVPLCLSEKPTTHGIPIGARDTLKNYLCFFLKFKFNLVPCIFTW